MTTNSTLKPSKMQTELDAASSGLSSSTFTTLNSMMLMGAMMSKAEVIAKLRSLSAVYAAATNARAALTAAVNARKAARVSTVAFYNAMVMALKLALGPANEGMLPNFGVALPKQRKAANLATKTIAKAKAAATREARGIMGSQQRLAITTQPSMSIQVLGPDGRPVNTPASSSITSTLSTSNTMPSGSNSKSTVSTPALTAVTPEPSSTAPKSTP